MVRTMFNTVSDKKIGIWGFAFKKDTNDTRESASIYVCRDLLLEKARVCIYDPQVDQDQVIRDLEEVFQEGDGGLSDAKRKLIDDHVTFADNCSDASRDAHAIAILTEWDEFAEVDFEAIYHHMKKPAFVFDGRNKLKHLKLGEKGFDYYGIGF